MKGDDATRLDSPALAGPRDVAITGDTDVLALLLALVLIAILFGAGFASSLLWYVAIIALILWLVGFVARPGGRWYYW